MFRKKKTTSDSPEVQEAMAERDALIDDVKVAIKKVDRLKDELLDEYAEAERVRTQQWR